MQRNRVGSRTRVLFLDHTAQLGGGEIALFHLLNHLDLDRVEPVVVLFEEGPFADQLRQRFADVEILTLAPEIAQTRKASIGWKSFFRISHVAHAGKFVLRLSRWIKQKDVEIVHTNSLKAHLLGGIAGRLAGKPVVWHLRDRISPDYLPEIAVRAVRFTSRLLPTFVIANSQATLNTVCKDSDTKRLTRRYRSIHDGCVIPESCGPEPNPSVKSVGLIGRISPWKGQDVFIKAAALLCREFPNVRFQIIGAALFSETAYEAEIKDLCRNLGVEKEVEFTGFVRDISGMLENLSIVVHASTVSEPFGQVVIEGMAAGKPVIATDGGGVREIVDHNITGLLVPMGDERALASAISDLLLDPVRARQLGVKGREKVREKFTLSRVAREVEQVYEGIIEAKRGTRNRVNVVEAKLSTKMVQGVIDE